MHYAVTGTTGRSSARVIAIEEPTGASCLEHEDHPGRRLGAMRTGLTIGPPEDIAMTIEALGAAELCNVYGSTETYGNCAVTDADDPLALRLHSQGLPLPGMTIRAVDPVARRPLPEGEIGELAVRGYVTPGRVITGRRNSMQSASPVGSECLIGRECHDHQDDKNGNDEGWNKPGSHCAFPSPGCGV
jgi:acyl-CoA synthetase (AMP-forming)/AMP-acid ligase II